VSNIITGSQTVTLFCNKQTNTSRGKGAIYWHNINKVWFVNLFSEFPFIRVSCPCQGNTHWWKIGQAQTDIVHIQTKDVSRHTLTINCPNINYPTFSNWIQNCFHMVLNNIVFPYFPGDER